MALCVGDYGQTIRVNVTLDGAPLDLTNATIGLTLIRPKGGTAEKTMVGHAGYATWVIDEGTIDQTGGWKGKMAILVGGAQYHTAFTFAIAAV
jgi:hypothetical protein